MKVLVTGAAGYIGSVLVRKLLNKGYHVRGLDILNFGGESLLGVYNHQNFEFIKGDIRNKKLLQKSLTATEAVIHLAAIVGDPACDKQPILAKETNLLSSKVLFDLCISTKNVKRFIFASSCSNYGKMEGDAHVDESSPLKPISLYAQLKVKCEEYILESKGRDNFIPTILRFATVYGISPRMRFDLTVNEFVRELFFGHELKVFGEQFWRPYCHVEDLAQSCITVLESEPKIVRANVFNVGDTNENYQKQTIVEEISKFVKNARIRYIHKEEDPRDYKVNFSKIRNLLGFSITKTVPDGISEIHSMLMNGLLKNPYSPTYRNI